MKQNQLENVLLFILKTKRKKCKYFVLFLYCAESYTNGCGGSLASLNTISLVLSFLSEILRFFYFQDWLLC